MMVPKKVYLLVLTLFVSSIYAESRNSDILGTLVDFKHTARDNISHTTGANYKHALKISHLISNDAQLCSLCGEVATQAINYMSENETRTEVIGALHKACSWIYSFEKECIVLVDYYMRLLFLELASVQPEQFCEKFDLCVRPGHFLAEKQQILCTTCREVVDKVLAKLNDPDTELEIIELFLKTCSGVQSFVQECKRLVFHYGPLMLARFEKFLMTKDVCVAISACKAGQESASFIPLFDA